MLGDCGECGECEELKSMNDDSDEIGMGSCMRLALGVLSTSDRSVTVVVSDLPRERSHGKGAGLEAAVSVLPLVVVVRDLLLWTSSVSVAHSASFLNLSRSENEAFLATDSDG
jgi:hypothetical protein